MISRGGAVASAGLGDEIEFGERAHQVKVISPDGRKSRRWASKAIRGAPGRRQPRSRYSASERGAAADVTRRRGVGINAPRLVDEDAAGGQMVTRQWQDQKMQLSRARPRSLKGAAAQAGKAWLRRRAREQCRMPARRAQRGRRKRSGTRPWPGRGSIFFRRARGLLASGPLRSAIGAPPPL